MQISVHVFSLQDTWLGLRLKEKIKKKNKKKIREKALKRKISKLLQDLAFSNELGISVSIKVQ